MRLSPLVGSALCALAIGATAPAAIAECDISQTKCALNGKKCNIHFRNRTGGSGGSDGSSGMKQNSGAQAIQVKAVDEKNNKVGNKLTIQASAKKTMNLDKRAKKGFDAIKITSANAGGWYHGTKIGCDDIIETLNGTGTCKIFAGEYGGVDEGRVGVSLGNPYLGYQCDGGDVGGPD